MTQHLRGEILFVTQNTPPTLGDPNNWLSWTVLFEQRFENVKETVEITPYTLFVSEET